MGDDVSQPTPWQKRMWYAALTAVALAVLSALTVLAGYLVVKALAFLQPLLIPIVVAVILAYLLEPVVAKFCTWGMRRTNAVLLLFLLLASMFSGIVLWVAPAVSHQAVEFGKTLPEHSARAEKLMLSTLDWVRGMQQRFDPALTEGAERTMRDEVWALAGSYVQDLTLWVQERLPAILTSSGAFLQRSLGGFLGVAGIALSLLLVPLFLFFFYLVYLSLFF